MREAAALLESLGEEKRPFLFHLDVSLENPGKVAEMLETDAWLKAELAADEPLPLVKIECGGVSGRATCLTARAGA